MDWHTMVTTFATVFLAELGDKTNLSTMMLAAQKKSIWSVFAGASLALCLTSLIGALVGGSLYRVIAPGTLRSIAGIAFILMGIMVLLGKV